MIVFVILVYCLNFQQIVANFEQNGPYDVPRMCHTHAVSHMRLMSHVIHKNNCN